VAGSLRSQAQPPGSVAAERGNLWGKEQHLILSIGLSAPPPGKGCACSHETPSAYLTPHQDVTTRILCANCAQYCSRAGLWYIQKHLTYGNFASRPSKGRISIPERMSSHVPTKEKGAGSPKTNQLGEPVTNLPSKIPLSTVGAPSY
jgi:hypothetical protein